MPTGAGAAYFSLAFIAIVSSTTLFPASVLLAENGVDNDAMHNACILFGGWRKMKTVITLLATTILAFGLAKVAEAKTLVYCSEGSPEGFDAALYTSGTTFDAASRTIYNRLAEFERGTTTLTPGLAESWDISDDGLTYTFKLRPGVKFHTTDYFTPTRDLNADTSFSRSNGRAIRATPSTSTSTAPAGSISTACRCRL